MSNTVANCQARQQQLPSLTARISRVLCVVSTLGLAACGGSSGGGNASMDGDEGIRDDGLFEVPAGGVTRYGAVNVTDDEGVASDVVAGFFQIDSGIDGDSVIQTFNRSEARCTVSDSGTPSVFVISASFLPQLDASAEPIGVGDTLSLDTPEGQYAMLEKTDVGAFLFYSLPVATVLPREAVPSTLSVTLLAEAGALAGIHDFIEVDTLDDMRWSGAAGANTTIDARSVFNWTPGSSGNQWVRIDTQTAGGFFLDESLSVSCLVPDNGQFRFPSDVQEAMGRDFQGSPPTVSRLAMKTVSNNDTLLFLIRESFDD